MMGMDEKSAGQGALARTVRPGNDYKSWLSHFAAGACDEAFRPCIRRIASNALRSSANFRRAAEAIVCARSMSRSFIVNMIPCVPNTAIYLFLDWHQQLGTLRAIAMRRWRNWQTH